MSARPGTLTLRRLSGWLLPYAVRRWPGLLLVVGGALVGVGLNVLQPWPMKLLIDNVVNDAPVPAEVVYWAQRLHVAITRENLLGWAVGGTVGLFLLNSGLGMANSHVSTGFGRRMVYDVAVDLFTHLQRLSLSFHRSQSLGDTMRRITSDCGCASSIVVGALLPVLTSVFTLGAVFTVMWQMSPQLTLLSLGVIPLMGLALRRYTAPMVATSYIQQEAEGALFSHIEQTLSSIPAIHADCREDENLRRFRSFTGAHLVALLAATDVQMRFKILLNLATAAGTAAILWAGGGEVLAGHLTVGSILVFLAYLAALYGPLNTLMQTSSTISGAFGSALRVIEILDRVHDMADKPHAIALTAALGHVRIENASFGYTAGQPILKNISLEAFPGETVAIVGPTGSGKTTLVGMIPRFYDLWEGAVYVDGHNIHDLQLRTLRGQIALVLQEPFLFPISIAENIAYGRPDAGREEIVAAARAANAHPFIERLPQGYDTVIGERGATLSGGERQRLSIARALLKDAPILILDEPTSALDAETEALLLEALRRLMAGRTTFIIAHRLSTIREADRIVVLDGGQIVESGKHEDLLAGGALYSRLHSIQFGDAPRQ